jgi:hypothetical protein
MVLSSSFSFLHFYHVRWRLNRPNVLTEAQFQAAKDIGINTISRFFPNNRDTPVFVALQPNVAVKLKELEDELRDKLPYPADEKAEGEPAAKRVHVDAAPLPPPPPPPPPAPPLHPPPPHPLLDMDGGMEFKEVKEEIHDVQWELRNWFSPAQTEQLKWSEPQSQPSVKWKEDEKKFPRLSLLARRFLCILPTSAPSERVWSGFGHIITSHSSTIDSTTAAQKMYLKHNHDLLDQVPLQ